MHRSWQPNVELISRYRIEKNSSKLSLSYFHIIMLFLSVVSLNYTFIVISWCKDMFLFQEFVSQAALVLYRSIARNYISEKKFICHVTKKTIRKHSYLLLKRSVVI